MLSGDPSRFTARPRAISQWIDPSGRDHSELDLDVVAIATSHLDRVHDAAGIVGMQRGSRRTELERIGWGGRRVLPSKSPTLCGPR